MSAITQIPAVQKTVSPVDGRVYVERMKFAPPGSQLTLAPFDNHVSLPLQLEIFAPSVVEWFEKGLRRP